MAERKGTVDKYANKAYGTVTESAANTLTFAQINTNVNILEKVAWILHRIDWYPNLATLQQLDDDADALTFALVSSNQMSTLDLSNPAVIDMNEITALVATAVGVRNLNNPITRDFTMLPGGGLIILPRPLYVGFKGTGLATVGSTRAILYFSAVALVGEDYYDVLDSYRIVQ